MILTSFHRNGRIRFAAAFFAIATGFTLAAWTQQPLQVIAYVFPREAPLTADQVDAKKLTRINFSFGDLEKGTLLDATKEEQANLATLTSLKQSFPKLQILVSIGGWGGSKNFSDAVLTPDSRKVFVDSVMSYVRKYKLDGVDIDWEYPGMVGDGNTFRPEDAQHFTEFLRSLRLALDRGDKQSKTHTLLTIAAGASDAYLAHGDVHSWQKYLDTVNLMSYDYREPTDHKITGNHSPLFDDPTEPQPVSTDRSVRAFEAAGVPADKLVVGVPFYGHVWAQVPAENHGLFQPGAPPKNGYAPYNVILSDYLGKGYTRYWDDAAKVPFLYSADAKQFVSYEDPESLALKCAYIRDKKLAGIMFWELLNDPTGQLLQTIDTSFHANTPVAAGEGKHK